MESRRHEVGRLPSLGLARALGPGIMYAGAAIGVSHLVQSTRAGADYGFSLIWVIVIVHLLKYPFFEYGSRYAAATGESLLVGYRRVGRWALIGYLFVACGLSIPTAAVLTIVTAGMAAQLIPVDLTPMVWAIILLSGCLLMLASGGYPLLERVMKVLMVLLAVGTIVAVAAAATNGPVRVPADQTPSVWSHAGIAFLVALMGWMPTPVDASAWPSLWMEERGRRIARQATLREALFDFNVGYGASLATAVAFLSLGALIMFRTGATFAGSADEFAAQFVSMYTAALGNWSRLVIVAAAFITMLSTMLTVLDGYPRVVAAGCRVAWRGAEKFERALFGVVMIMMAAGALFIFACLTSHMRILVDATTTLAFLSAPLFAFLNIRAIAVGPVPKEATPPRWLSLLSWIGLAFLVGFSVLFLAVFFFPRA